MSSLKSVDAEEPAAFRYLGVARSNAAVPQASAGVGTSPAAGSSCGAAWKFGSGGPCAACLAAIAI
eukprot:2932049-Heterocapsa_arctica.AAC.1